MKVGGAPVGALGADGPETGRGLKLSGPGVLETIREVIAVAGTVKARAAGTSMWPTIPDGSLVTLIRLDRSIRPGQIVLIDWNGMPVLHRVERVVGDLVHTIGDACTDPDPPTSFADVVALATSVADNRGEITLTGSWRHGIRSWTLYAAAGLRLALARRWRWLRRDHVTPTPSLISTMTQLYENESSATPGAAPRDERSNR
jgi:hypothetical protein